MAPSRERILDIFSNLGSGNHDAFYAHVAPEVEWTVMSQSALGGTYKSLLDFRKSTAERLRSLLNPSTPLKMVPHNIIGAGAEEEWTTVEMRMTGEAKNGMRYDQTYAWCVRWAKNEDRIVQVRAYLDTALVDRLIESNE